MINALNITVFVSGSGTNLQRIIDAIASGELVDIKLNQVIADRPCKAIQRAIQHQIPYFEGDRKDPDFWSKAQQHIPQSTHLIVLAGFLSILPEEFIDQWNRKIINIHPSLLPKYGGKGMYGIKVHQSVLANHEKETGATVHFVTSGIDEGEIILQKSLKIKPNETPEWLATKVHQIEYEILIKAIQIIQEEQKF